MSITNQVPLDPMHLLDEGFYGNTGPDALRRMNSINALHVSFKDWVPSDFVRKPLGYVASTSGILDETAEMVNEESAFGGDEYNEPQESLLPQEEHLLVDEENNAELDTELDTEIDDDEDQEMTEDMLQDKLEQQDQHEHTPNENHANQHANHDEPVQEIDPQHRRRRLPINNNNQVLHLEGLLHQEDKLSLVLCLEVLFKTKESLHQVKRIKIVNFGLRRDVIPAPCRTILLYLLRGIEDIRMKLTDRPNNVNKNIINKLQILPINDRNRLLEFDQHLVDPAHRQLRTQFEEKINSFDGDDYKKVVKDILGSTKSRICNYNFPTIISNIIEKKYNVAVTSIKTQIQKWLQKTCDRRRANEQQARRQADIELCNYNVAVTSIKTQIQKWLQKTGDRRRANEQQARRQADIEGQERDLLNVQ
ncbi:hypothetical protein TSAR_012810 [Trichomalopsis sarcophagae]|uniref:Uncharacterized protein n=1 Tax=Trichomalopsis sarcophagae TaxID=543379 RepID=A0A232EFM0_9HYME|nr:hypothetical protein TSAR_012810 [Trichomalopsis sarcophagae]